MFEYVLGGVLISAFSCWYLFWPGALLATYGITWLREDGRVRETKSYRRRWWPRRRGAPIAAVAVPSRDVREPAWRRASLALLAIAPLLLVARILATPNMAVNWFRFESFDDWPNWFTTDLLDVAPWVQVGAAALVVAARRGTRRASACVAAASVLMVVAYVETFFQHPGTMAEVGLGGW